MVRPSTWTVQVPAWFLPVHLRLFWVRDGRERPAQFSHFSNSFVVTSGFAMTSDFTSWRLRGCFLIPMSDATDAHGSASFILDNSGVSMVFLVHPPLFCLGLPRDEYICLAFPFPLRVTCGLVIHAQNLRAFHGVKLHFVADSDVHVSIIIPVFRHRRTVRLSTWTVQVSALFDVSCWTAGREQLMHMSHFSDSPTAFSGFDVISSSCLRVWLHFVSDSLTLFTFSFLCSMLQNGASFNLKVQMSAWSSLSLSVFDSFCLGPPRNQHNFLTFRIPL